MKLCHSAISHAVFFPNNYLLKKDITMLKPQKTNSLHIQQLFEEDIPHLLKLQTIVYNALDDDKKRFILPKSPEYLKKHFTNGSTAIGVWCEGVHVAQCLIALPSADFPSTAMVDIDIPHPVETLCVLQGLLVHPNYRGLSLGIMMINAFIEIGEFYGKKHAYAETEQRNKHSWSLFERAGMPIVSKGTDPEDGANVYHHYLALPFSQNNI
ncbi:MAG: hypothetical protein CMH30_03250 [Micavibrio sp.]|nr:hypothetical protein [Micavibrio sp.]|tara:strand:- start:527 stop:1159 length:633 start_codon:yes stop_codon:yes gene_type:complete